MALGALARDMAWLVMRDVAWLVGAGIAVALPLAVALSRLVGSQLCGVTPVDPSAMTMAVAMLATVAAIAGLIPAIRAARMNPTSALHHH
jgi:ABC-type antimicrobial peptide transport system permease subunit